MKHILQMARRCRGICTAMALGLYPWHALALSQSYSPLGIDPFDEYISGQHNAPRNGVIDPYTGQEVDLGTTLQTQFTSPYMSYLRESQNTTEEGLTYDVGRGLSLNYDPTTKRVHTELNLTGKENKRIKLRIKPKEFKAVYIYRW